MRLFLSAGEPSGDMHGANLVRRLREHHPALDVLGFGGDKMAAAGARLVYPLCDFAVMGIGAAVLAVPKLLGILRMAEQAFDRERPDALVMIDYPGFHWWLARAAKKRGIPVCYFVPPQIWAWAQWRATKMRRLTDQVLSSLPFEHDFLQQRGIASRLVGHPYFDELEQQRLDGDFLAAQRRKPGTVVGILPGSRKHELHYNVPSLLRAAKIIHTKRPDVRFLVGCLKPHQAEFVRARAKDAGLPIEIHHGRTPEVIHLAHSCMAVSGSVSLELLYRGKPATILYRVSTTTRLLGKFLMRAKYITLVNLLADRPLLPEHVSIGCRAEGVAADVLGWLQDRARYEGVCGELAALRARFAQPGACDRAAAAIGELVAGAAARRAA
ncbi:MAG: lipid-A-disaccharide synthase [Gemmataceae bacterium]